jgi:polyisoprenoid-binding protein YceI
VPGVALAARAVSFAAAAAVAIACHSSTSPSASDLSGTWTGTGSYPNAPFELKLVQTGSSLRGSYSDRHDSSNSVDGTLAGDVMTASIDFGDAKLHFEGTVEDARRVRGTMRTSALGNTPYPFTMTR